MDPIQRVSSNFDQSTLPASCAAFFIGHMTILVDNQDIVRRAEALITGENPEQASLRFPIPQELAAQEPNAFLVVFPSGAHMGVTAAIVKEGSPAIEFPNPIELIDPALDQITPGTTELTLIALRRDS